MNALSPEDWRALSVADQLIELRRRRLRAERTGYDGHNRRAGLVSMHRLVLRRARRRWARRLARPWEWQRQWILRS